MGNWQVTGRLKASFAVVAGAVAVSMVAPSVAQAAANEDSSSNDWLNRVAANLPAKPRTVPASTVDSPARESSAPVARQAPSGATGTVLEQAEYRIEHGQRVAVPPRQLDLNDDLTRLVYTFLPTRTVLDPATAQAEVLAWRDALAQYLSSQIVQIRKVSEDPDGAVREFVRSELQRFQDDPTGYLGELRTKSTTTAAEAVTGGSLDGSANPASAPASGAAAPGQVLDEDRPAATAATQADTGRPQPPAAPADSTGAGAVTIGDRVAARAQSAVAQGADAVQQGRHHLGAAGGKVWSTELTADEPDAPAGPAEPAGVGHRA